METTMLKVSQIQCNNGQIEGLPANPRQITQQKLALLKQSISESPEMLHLRELLVYPFGNKYVVIGGNMRYRAAIELGIKELPCKIIDPATPIAKLREYTIKDNNGYGAYDWDMLANEWDDVPLLDWGVDMPDFEEADSEEENTTVEEDDFDKETDTVVCRCQRGDIWQLGKHRVMCGDSTSEEDINRLRGGGVG